MGNLENSKYLLKKSQIYIQLNIMFFKNKVKEDIKAKTKTNFLKKLSLVYFKSKFPKITPNEI